MRQTLTCPMYGARRGDLVRLQGSAGGRDGLYRVVAVLDASTAALAPVPWWLLLWWHLVSLAAFGALAAALGALAGLGEFLVLWAAGWL